MNPGPIKSLFRWHMWCGTPVRLYIMTITLDERGDIFVRIEPPRATQAEEKS